MTGPDAPELLDTVEDAARVRERALESLAGVRRILPVMSGKGGVGKSLVATQLAGCLGAGGRRIGLLDADLHGPSTAKMLGLRGKPVRVGGDGRLRPTTGPNGLGVQSMDFFLQGNEALDWDGPAGEGAMLRSAMEQSALADLIGRTAWGELDLLVVDLAPGSDRLPALCRWLPVDRVMALAVTIPSEVSLLAVERSLRRAHEARIPLLGLVENFASVVCASCGHEGALFREAPAERLASKMGIELLAQLPFDAALAASADRGELYASTAGVATAVGRAFHDLAERVLGYAAAAEEGLV